MFLKEFKKNGNKCLIIAEVAQAHNGSLGTAHAYIDAIADAGADAVKFQTHIAEAESTPEEPWRVKFSKQDKTRYDYWKKKAIHYGVMQCTAAYPCPPDKIGLNLSMISGRGTNALSGFLTTPGQFSRD